MKGLYNQGSNLILIIILNKILKIINLYKHITIVDVSIRANNNFIVFTFKIEIEEF